LFKGEKGSGYLGGCGQKSVLCFHSTIRGPKVGGYTHRAHILSVRVQ